VVGGNAALWLRLDNLSDRGGDGLARFSAARSPGPIDFAWPTVPLVQQYQLTMKIIQA
jgi:hypothetical protein